MLPRPPSSTLFAYTTLFRSPRLGQPFAGEGVIGGQVVEAVPGVIDAIHQAVIRPAQIALELEVVGRVREDRDRKSTRLNSSHGYISYAVFCLKKKKRK